jgi:hypothetical protein
LLGPPHALPLCTLWAATPETASGPFQRWPPTGRAACGCVTTLLATPCHTRLGLGGRRKEIAGDQKYSRTVATTRVLERCQRGSNGPQTVAEGLALGLIWWGSAWVAWSSGDGTWGSDVRWNLKEETGSRGGLESLHVDRRWGRGEKR